MRVLASTKASRPPPNTSTEAKLSSLMRSNNKRASVRLVITDSVMRSCNRPCHALTWAWSKSADSHKAVARSMRKPATLMPQLRAMSVALDDQGEMVPKRGVIKHSCSLRSVDDGCSAVNKSHKRWTSSVDNTASLWMKYQNSLLNWACSGRCNLRAC